LHFLLVSTRPLSAVETLSLGLDRMLVKAAEYCWLRCACILRPGVDGFLQRR
jgi:hypothetical protein